MRARRHGTHQAPLEPGGIRETRAPLLGLNRLRPPFWPPSEIPRAVLDPFYQMLLLAQGRPVFTADYYAVDGVTGKVASFIDWSDATHLLAQATSARQCALPAPSALFAGKNVIDFPTGCFYQSNRAAASWAPWSEGAGSEWWLLTSYDTAATRVVARTSASNDNSGFAVVQFAANTRWAVNKTGTDPVTVTIAAAATDTPYLLNARHATAASPQYRYKATGLAAATGSYATAITVQTPDNSLVLGANPDASFGLDGKVAFAVFADRIDPVLQSAVSAWSQQTYGVSA